MCSGLVNDAKTPERWQHEMRAAVDRIEVLPATLFGDEPAALCGDGTATVAEHAATCLT